jgi:DNA-binding XRE family transcriptional regulator
MIAKKDWLWDRKTSLNKAKKALKEPNHAHFLSLSALLLSRKNSPKEVFGVYLKPVLFLQNWLRIKRQMRKDYWNNPRIEYWQAIYEKLRDKYRTKGILPAKKNPEKPQEEITRLIADKIRVFRKQKRTTQAELAKRLKISQQMISRIEQGRENISILTLKKIVDSLGASLNFEVVAK